MNRTTKNRRTSLITHATLVERPLEAIHYPIRLRIHDWWAGRRDGAIDLTGLATTVETELAHAGEHLTTDSSVWLRHNQHRRDERREHERLAHQARTLDIRIRQASVASDLEVAQVDLVEARQAINAIPELTESEQTNRGGAEQRASDEVVRARRHRERTRSRVIPAVHRFQALSDAIHLLRTDLNNLNAQVDVLELITATRQARITEFHDRRASIYRRAYLRALRRACRRNGGRLTRPRTPVTH